MQAQQLCQRNFDSRWTRDQCETFTAYLLLQFTHIPVGPGINWHYMYKWGQMQLASQQQQVEKQDPEMCWLLLIHFCWYNPLGRRERETSCWYTLCYTLISQRYSCTFFPPFLSIKMYLCSLEAQQTHKLSHNNESVKTLCPTSYKLFLILFLQLSSLPQLAFSVLKYGSTEMAISYPITCLYFGFINIVTNLDSLLCAHLWWSAEHLVLYKCL